MDCEQVKEILDAYVLGAAEREEARGLEEHVADCVACWDQLTEAQRVAASLALSVPLRAASPKLRERVLASARGSLGRPSSLRLAIPDGFRRLWPAAVAALGTAAVALSALLFLRMDRLGDENDRLQAQVVAAGRVTDQLRQMEAIRSVPDVRSVTLASTAALPEAMATFYWSESAGTAVLVCNNLPTLEPHQAYQLWLLVGDRHVSAGTFNSFNDIAVHTLDLQALGVEQGPKKVGVSIEPAKGSARPSGDFILLAHLPQE